MIRRFTPEDAVAVSDLIATTLRTTNIKDYSSDYIEKEIQTLSPEALINRNSWTHFYLYCQAARIIGCGAIGPY